MKISKLEETPVQILEKGKNNIYIKRDDLIPFSFGGNKVRIAYEYIKDLQEKKCTCMLAYGNSKSNLCRAIANMCNLYNINCYVISPIEDGEEYEKTNNSIIVEQLVKKIITCRKSEVPETIENTLHVLKKHGEIPYYIYTEENVQVAMQSYIKTYDEIKSYEANNKIRFDYIFLASGTGTTQSGLVCGQILNNDTDRKIVGISIARNQKRGRNVIDNNLKNFLKNNNLKSNVEYFFVDEYVLDGYGKYNKEIQETIKNMLFTKGIPLDSTYTGKAYWGMTKYIEKNQIMDKNILFIHTGGTPLFFDNIETLLQ